jgi:hypothetical protein
MPNNLEDPNIFELENTVMNHLNAFNKEYRLYLTCKDPVPASKTKPQDYFSRGICNGVTKTITDLENAYKDLTNTTNGSLYKLNKAVNELTPNKANDYQRNYNNILNKYAEIVKNRQSLDAKLSELYQIGDTTSNFYQKKLVSTSYTKILLTVLATSLVVTAFVVARHKT